MTEISQALPIFPPGEWELIHRHDIRGGFYDKSEFDKNTCDTEAFLHSRLTV